MKRNTSFQKILILHDIRSSQNVGALFRTADAAGINKIYLSGYTPAPIDKFNRANTQLTKSALGAEKSVPWEKVSTIFVLLRKLEKENVQTIAIEQSKDSVDYKKVKIKGSVAFILGNEVEGLPKKILEKVSVVAEIPMKGEKESLNVSVAGGVALFRILGV